MNFFHSITFRFTLWYLAILGILLGLFGCGVYITLSHVIHRNLDASLMARADQLLEFKDIIGILEQGTFEDHAGEFVAFFFYHNGRLRDIASKGQKLPVPRSSIDQALSGKAFFSDLVTPRGEKLRAFLKPYTPESPYVQRRRPPRPREPRGPEAENIRPERTDRPRRPPPPPRPPGPQRLEIQSSVLVVARPTRDMEEVLGRLVQIMMIALPLTLVFSGGGGVFLARRAFKPVAEITKTAREIGESDLGRRIQVETRDELGALADTLNQMIERLQKAFERQKQFTGDASHELRAPLAIIQAESTLALQKNREPVTYQKALENIAQESERMSHVINQLLTLARADAGKGIYHFEIIDPAGFIREVCEDMAVLCREKGLTLSQNLTEGIRVRADAKSMHSLLINLINNAVAATEAGGRISVRLQRTRDAALIAVMDTGIGIPTAELPLIFERFYRVDKARSRSSGNSGLGLAICRHIVDAHGGCIKVDSKLGRGACFQVSIPAVKVSV